MLHRGDAGGREGGGSVGDEKEGTLDLVTVSGVMEKGAGGFGGGGSLIYAASLLRAQSAKQPNVTPEPRM